MGTFYRSNDIPPSGTPSALDNESRAALYEMFARQRPLLVMDWYHAILGTSFSPFEEGEILEHLEVLADRTIDLVLANTENDHAAQEIGAVLPTLHFTHPMALGQTVAILGQYLQACLIQTRLLALLPRLTTVLGAIATGYFSQSRTIILMEQERIRAALFAERRAVEAALRMSDTRLRTIVTNVPIILFVTDHTGVVTLIEGKGLEGLRIAPSMVVGQTITDVLQALPPMDIQRTMRHFARALAGETFTVVTTLVDVVFETRYGPLRDHHDVVLGVIGIAIDITERIRVERELADAHHRLAERHEAELLHVAHDLHDSVVQQLMGIKYQLEALHSLIVHDPLATTVAGLTLTSGLLTTRSEVLGVVTRLREVIGELRPAGLEDLGLSAALQGYVARLRELKHGALPAIELDLAHIDTTIPQFVAVCLFRVAQEALHNALQHAHAEHITIRLRQRSEVLVLSVRDDGLGFAVPALLSAFARTNHFGLMGIEERVRWVGGRLQIDSHPGAGTDLTVRIPISRK